MSETARQLVRFCLVGGVGFCVDAAILCGLVAAGWSPWPSRVASYLGAATLTWSLNRTFTFRRRRRAGHREWLAYVAMNGIGAAINYAVFALVLLLGPFEGRLLTGVALGSLAGLAFNFSGCRLYLDPSPAAKTG